MSCESHSGGCGNGTDNTNDVHVWDVFCMLGIVYLIYLISILKFMRQIYFHVSAAKEVQRILLKLA